MFAAFATAVASAVWALLAEQASLPTVLAAVALTGCTALIATLVAAAQPNLTGELDVKWSEACILALVFVAFQMSAYAAFAADKAAALAIVNCNVIIVTAHKIATAETATSQTLATAAAAVLYVALGVFIAYDGPRNP